MTLKSLRKYLESQTELELYLGSLTSFDLKTLIKAEEDIDNAIKIYSEGYKRKFLRGKQVIPASRVTLTSTTATITGLGFDSGYFQYTVLEIMTGSKKGTRILIQDSTKSGSSTTLTYFDTQDGVTGSEMVRIFQYGKVPMYRDHEYQEAQFAKTIPEWLKQAVAFQYAYRTNEGNKLDDERVQLGYNVSEDSWSERYEEGVIKGLLDRISPQARDILQSEGVLNIQSMP